MTIWDLGSTAEARRINAAALARVRARGQEPAGSDQVISIRVVGTICDPLAEQIEAAIAAKPNATEIAVSIASRGGFIRPARRIYDALRRHGARVNARVLVNCESAAVDVLLAGDYREAAADATFLLHEVSVDPPDRWTAAEHAKVADQIRDLNREFANFYALRTGHAASKFAAEMRTEAPMSASRAMTFGLIHAIV